MLWSIGWFLGRAEHKLGLARPSVEIPTVLWEEDNTQRSVARPRVSFACLKSWEDFIGNSTCMFSSPTAIRIKVLSYQ